MEEASRVARDVVRDSNGEGECNAQFAMRVGAIMTNDDASRRMDLWLTRAIDLPMEQFCEDVKEVFGGVISQLMDLPMVIGLTWFKNTGNFHQYRTIVHRFRIWQIGNRVGIDAHHVPQKVHKMIEIHSDFMPSAAALCVFHPLNGANIKQLRLLSAGIFETLKPVVTLTDVEPVERIERMERILYERMEDLMHTSSNTTVETMIEVSNVLLDAIVDQMEEGVEKRRVSYSIERSMKLHKLPDPMSSQHLFLVSTLSTDEQADLVMRVDDPCALACACISMPTTKNVSMLPALFRRLTATQMLCCARALNASDMLAIDDAKLRPVAEAAHLSDLHSAWVSVLNATVTLRTTGRWLDVLGRVLTADENAMFEKHGADAAVVKYGETGKHEPVAQHRLLFLDDVCKLLDDDNDGYRALHITFYTQNKKPISYARMVDLSKLPGLSSGSSDTSNIIDDVTLLERHALFAHTCYDELRMHNRHVKLPAQSSKPAEGLPIDVDTMGDFEIALRHEANAMFKKYVDLDAIKDQTVEHEAIDEAIELVRHEDLNLPSNDINAIDAKSLQVLRKLALIKRKYMSKVTYRSWPYKTATGCRMRLVQWPPDSFKPLSTLDPKIEALIL